MKKAAFLSIALILFGSYSFAQAKPAGLNNIGNRLSAVNFIDSNTGFAAGDHGTVLGTTDGGMTWTSEPSGTSNDLYAASFPGASAYYAGGAGGLVIKTSDGGITWQNFTSGSTIAIQSFSFIDADTGFLINGNDRTASKTIDGGATWNLCLQAGQVLYSVCFPDADTGYVSGVNGIIMKTTDGGSTWTSQASGTTETLFLIYFFNENSGYAVGSNGKILHTSDGGANWTGQNSGVTARLMCVRFTDINTGYAVGDYGTILKTVNGGATWSYMPSGTSIDLYSICFTDSNIGYAVGGYMNSGVILKTENAGLTWTDQSNVEGRTLNVPAEYSTIQEAISVANYGDTVLVQPGTYLENINFLGKKIKVASLYLLTGDDAYISQTVIDGNNVGSVVYFSGGEDSTALLSGFTLTNGNSSGGGGIYCYASSPRLEGLDIKGNFANVGGGIYFDYSSFPHLKKVRIANNTASTNGGGIFFVYSKPVFDGNERCNIYDNKADAGNDLYGLEYLDSVEVVVDTFSVLNPTRYYAEPVSFFRFDILHGKNPQVQADLYVSPGGDDSNSGLSEAEPLKTIRHALQVIYPDSLNPLTIHLLDGVYSPSATGEIFPLNILDYVTISGASESAVILDAEGLSGVFQVYNALGVHISGLTITGGLSGEVGGGIDCYYSKVLLTDLKVSDNSAVYGGGIYFYASSPELKNVSVINNTAQSSGGGIFFSDSYPVFDSLDRCNIYSNSAPSGNDLFSGWWGQANIRVVVDTFTVLIPRSIHAQPLGNFSFDILHGKLPQENITLFVSPDGDNGNTGLTSDDPLKTIQYALSVANQSSVDIYTIHLLNGTYSNSTNGESFPLNLNEYMSLEGESESGVILNGSGQTSVISINNSYIVKISNLTITGGNSDYGGGISCYSSNPQLQNVTLSGNYASSGGGIYFTSSRPYLENVTIRNNSAGNTGGGIYFGYSTPVFDSVNRCNIYLNSALYDGNDLFADYHVDVIVDTFTVLIPKSVQASPLSNFSFDILHGILPQANLELFVSTTGDNTNSGQTADEPLKTIQFALSEISADSVNFYTLHLLNGTYSPSSNGDVFPVNIPEFVKVEGESETGVILDAGGLSRVVGIWNSLNTGISDLTITGGNDFGGGIYCVGSNPDLKNLTVTGNSGSYGGGIYFDGYSQPDMQHITVTNNSAQYGGGMFCAYSDVNMENLTIANNNAGYNGGGLYIYYCHPVFDSVNRCNIYFNSASNGNDLYFDSYMDSIKVVVDTFSVLNPTGFHAWPIESYNFNIMNGKTAQIEADLFVSPDGSNSNSGLSSGDPLKTIYYAYSKMLADSLHPHTVNLLSGTYSPSSNGERFPVNILDFVNLSGESESAVILDAEGQSGVISKNGYQPVSIADLTVSGGHTDGYGGGINCAAAGLNLQNVSVINNKAASGGGIYITGNDSALIRNVSLANNSADYGGGIYINGTNPKMENVTIENNSAVYSGGGIQFDSGAVPVLSNVNVINNSSTNGGGIYFSYSQPVFDSINRCNIYLNTALNGNDLFSASWQGVTKVVVDTFTVLNPTGFHAWQPGNFDFDILHGKIVQEDADLYVSPDGNNNNTGLTAEEPLKNINRAYAKMLADSQHPHTVRLLAGTYSPSGNGDNFPVSTFEYISLSGESESSVILDAEGQSRIFEIVDRHNIEISNLTVSGGNTSGNGGAVFASNSSPVLQNVSIANSSAALSGGGLYCIYSSSPVLQNVTIENNTSLDGGGIYLADYCTSDLQSVTLSDNTASNSGGGLYLTNSSGSKLHNVTISHNTAGNSGGGIYSTFSGLEFDSINRCNIYLNSALKGRDLFSDNFMKVVVDTFSVLYPKPYYALPMDHFSFDILHGMIPQVNADVYVSAAGDDANSGLTADNPLKTIQYAVAVIAENSQDIHSIHMLNGTYSTSANGETFPVILPKYVKIAGESQEGVVIDAEWQARVFEFVDNAATGLSNLTVTGGYSVTNGGGIYSKNSKPDLLNITIRNNYSGKHGGGIYLDGSSPDISHLTISDNKTQFNGGGIYLVNSSPFMHDVTIEGDSSNNAGGGIYCATNSIPVMDSVTIAYNFSGSSGGGMYNNNSDPVLKNVVISGNSAAIRGGGICNNNSSPAMNQVSILNNTADIGGGIYCASAESKFVGAIFSGNSAASDGGGIYSASSKLDFINVDMADNKAVNGGGIFCYNSDLVLLNSVLWNESSSEVYFKETYDASSISVSCSDVKGGESGIVSNGNGTVNWLAGNLNSDPLFTGTGNFPYSISADSPCRDAGNPDTTGLFLPVNDLAGNPRIWDGRIDIGAYEWNNVGISNPFIQHSTFNIQNFPNPVSSAATFEYEIPEAGNVSLKLINNMGQEVATLVNEEQSAGEHTIRWNASGFPGGVYFYHFFVGNDKQSGKIIIVN